MILKGHYALFFKTHASFGAPCENFNEEDLYCQRQRCRPMTLVSANVTLCRCSKQGRSQGGKGGRALPLNLLCPPPANFDRVISTTAYKRVWSL